MAGNRIGGLKAAAKNLEKNPNFYREIGRRGGSASFATHGTYKGFAANPALAKIAGAKGGRVSRRRKREAL